MNENGHSRHGHSGQGSFWRSRAGLTLLVFLVVAGLLLAYEHRVHLFTGYGTLIALFALCIGMHMFMHGGHGGEGDHGDEADDERPINRKERS